MTRQSHEKESPRPTIQAYWLLLGLVAAVWVAAILSFGLAGTALPAAFFCIPALLITLLTGASLFWLRKGSNRSAFHRLLFCATVLLPFVLGCSGCQVRRALQQPIPASSVVGIDDQHTERIANVIRETMRKEHIPGLSIAVIDHGEMVWAQGFGWRDVHRRLPVDTDTQFQVGSISKPVTGLAVLLLSRAGKLDLQADVNSYLKGWQLESKSTNGPVTLRELLCHRAGTGPHGFAGFSESRTPPALVDVMSHYYFLNGPVKVKYPPGGFHYSGGGYCVIQKVLEDTTHLPFEDTMNQVLLEPLGMRRSHFRQPPLESETTNTAHGYGLLKALAYRGRWGVFPQKAAAGLWTTPQDLARWIVAVQKAQSGDATGPIPPAVAQEFLEPQFDSSMGMGICLDGEGENRGFFFAGMNPGFVARFGAAVSKGRAWIIMTNAEKNRSSPILKAVLEEFSWK